LQAVEYRSSFDLHSYLWLDDRHVFLKQFLIYGHQLSPEELEIMATAAANEEFPGLKENPSTTSQFKEQVIYEIW
jgi:dynein heavy chain